MEKTGQNLPQFSAWIRLKLFFLSKKGILILLIFSIIFLPVLYFTLLNQSEIAQKRVAKKVSQSASKIWQLTLSLDTKTDKISLTKIDIENGTAPASPFEDSPYLAQVLDSNSNILFKTHLNLIQDIAYNSYFAPDIASEEAKISAPKFATIETPLALPYFAQAKDIKILKNNIEILNISPPKLTSFSLFTPAFAQTNAASCKKLYVVFIAEGYTDFAKFRNDADTVKNSILSVEPFSKYADRIDFSKKIENREPLGCISAERLNNNCLNNTLNNKVSQMGQNQFPDLPKTPNFVKYVVLVDRDYQQTGPNSYLGGSAVIGGQLSVMSTHLETNLAAKLYIHEIGGHLIGKLFDRYIYPDLSEEEKAYKKRVIEALASNCSLNQEGESFWQQARSLAAGEKNAYPDCVIKEEGKPPITFAPSAQNCPRDRGNANSVMSALECGENNKNFDQVEKWYLEEKILKNYSSCSTSGNSSPKQTAPDQNKTSASTGHLICYPEGGITKRYDSDTIIVENRTGKDVKVSIQQNYCKFGTEGRSRTDADPVCSGYLGSKTDTIKANEKKTYKMKSLLSCFNNSLTIRRENDEDGGCYRSDNNEPWKEGVAFTDKFEPKKGSEPCSEIPTDGNSFVNNSLTISAGGPVDTGAAGTVTCKSDPNCTANQQNIHLCRLICVP